jgi:hypothetical protein
MRLPRYVNGFVDRHGKPRFYFRKVGFKKVPLPGLPWSPDFMAAYQTALAGQPAAIGAARVLPGSMHALAISYYNSPEYLAMKPTSQWVRRNIIEKFCRETDANGQRNGDKRAALLRREHIVRFMAVRASKPESANGLRKALRVVAPAMRGELAEDLRAVLLQLAISRKGVVFIWPLTISSDKSPLGRSWHESARKAAEIAKKYWIRITADKSLGGYRVRQADGKKLSEPDWPDKSFNELLTTAFADRIIMSEDHPVVRRLRGLV